MLVHIVGTRPNFIKAAPVIRELSSKNVEQLVLHTGQHYSSNMSNDILKDINMDRPNENLGINNGDREEKIFNMIRGIEVYLKKINANMVVLYGDVDSTFSASIAAKNIGVKIIHVESGLRSFDLEMPEEVNRTNIDAVSDILFCTEQSAIDNLINEGFCKSKMFLVGNTMIDTLIKVNKQLTKKIDGIYYVCTFHRPSNVDNKEGLQKIISILKLINKKVVFPIHPRTRKKIETYGIIDEIKYLKNVKLCKPMGYLDFMSIIKYSAGVITDSGGIQEETTFMGVPCVTFRKNTERPITLYPYGTNVLLNSVPNVCLKHLFAKRQKQPNIPLWDGKASQRIVDILLGNYNTL